MQSNSFKWTHPLAIIAVLGILLSCFPVASRAAETTTLGPTAAAQALALQANPALQMKVSFEARRQPLTDFLADLQKQSGVTLAAAPDAEVAQLRITARVRDMPLCEVMSALSRLYRVFWNHEKDTYVMHGSDWNAVEQELLQVGDMNKSNAYLLSRVLRQRGTEIAKAILPHANVSALKTREGFPVASLPQELQQELRRNFEARVAAEIVRGYRDTTEQYLDDCILHIRSAPGDSRVAVQDPMGQIIAKLPFLLPDPKEPAFDGPLP